MRLDKILEEKPDWLSEPIVVGIDEVIHPGFFLLNRWFDDLYFSWWNQKGPWSPEIGAIFNLAPWRGGISWWLHSQPHVVSRTVHCRFAANINTSSP